MRKGRRLDFILHMEEVKKTVLTKKKMIFGLFQNNHNRTEQEGLGGEKTSSRVHQRNGRQRHQQNPGARLKADCKLVSCYGENVGELPIPTHAGTLLVGDRVFSWGLGHENGALTTLRKRL